MYDQSNVERTLYGFWLSPYMSQVAHLLSETGLTYRYERVSPFQGSTLTPEHIERNPLGKIPTLLLSKMWLPRLVNGPKMEPFLLGKEPFLPDFQLFYTLELSQMFSELFEIPEMHLFRDDPALQTFYDAMCERPSTRKILAAKELELDVTKKELFGGFGAAYLDKHIDRRILGGLFGREV